MKFLKIFIFLFFIFLSCFFNHLVKGELLGEIEITEKSITIDASVVDTKINYLIDDTISKPKLIVTSVSGDATDINDILRVSDDKKSITFGDYNTVSGATTTTTTTINFNSLITIIISSIISYSFSGLFFKNGKSGSNNFFVFLIIILLSSFGIFNVAHSVNLSELSIIIDIKVPSTFKFNSLVLTLGSGSSNINGINADSLIVDSCTNAKDHLVELNQISIGSLLNICSTKEINIKKLQFSTLDVNINLTSSSDINLDFYNGYGGSILINGECQASSGSCADGGPILSINTKTGKTTITNQEVSCPIDKSWRVSPAVDVVPVSPAIITNQPSTDFRFNKDDIVYMGQYGYSDQSITNGPVENSFVVSYPTYILPSNFLVSKISPPSLKANVAHSFSLSVKLGQPLNAYNNIKNMTIYFFNPRDITDPRGSSQYFDFKDTIVPLYYKTFQGDFSSNTQFISTVLDFTPPVDIGTSIFALRIQKASFTGSDVTTVIIKDMMITVLGKTIATPSNLLLKDSELVSLPRPPLQLDPQDQSTCSYKSNDLVHWHNPSTWSNGVVPPPSSNIVLPEGKRVLISPCSISQTEIYQKITIPETSELVFADASMEMHVKDIYVLGKFTMGTTKCRYNAKINIVFHGEKTLQDTIAPFYGSKGIGVAAGGFISIHGKQYHNTWTKLAVSAWSGDRVVYVQDSVNWEVGQQVVVVTSTFLDEYDNQNEVMTIEAIQGKTIQFTKPLRSFHYGGQEYQSEIGLLSRRIVFQGDSLSSDSNSFGGHVMVMGEGQFSGLQLIRMGQTNIKARYPLHYHLGKVLKNSYISDCSVVSSYYRCYTIHGTNNVTLTRNVAFDVRGHCYYLEDGVEMDNTLSFNLAAYVHPIGRPAGGPSQIGEIFVESDSLRQPADCSASGFYITNAWNTIIGNSASGGWAGYAFPNLEKPIGNHRSVQMIPKAYPTKVFEGNTGHSSGYFFVSGSTIYVGANLTYNPVDNLLYYDSGRFERFTYTNGTVISGNEVPMRFNNTKIWLSHYGIGHWGVFVEVVSYESHDNVRSAMLFGEAWLSNAIVNGNSNNIARSINITKQGFQYYDTYVKTILTRINFRNYFKYSNSPNDCKCNNDEADNRLIISMTHGDVFKPQGISASKSITITNVAKSQYIGHNVLNTSGSRYFNFIDWDSSITGKKPGQPALVGSNELWWKFDNTCEYNQDWTCFVCEKGDKEIANIQFYVPGLIDEGVLVYDDFDKLNVGSIALFGSGINDNRSTVVTRNPGVTGVSNMGWYLYLKAGSPKYMKIWLGQVVFGQHIFLSIPYPTLTTFEIKSYYGWNNGINYNHTFSLANSAADVRAGNGTKYYFDGDTLYIKLINLVLGGYPWEYYERDGVKLYMIHTQFFITINAYNTVKQPNQGGFYENLPYKLPSSTL
ncbi:hypothetical protein DICPUDRAFT_82065 [Dictyostelium purpureum]|uniref:G8 domain-containing protein n=1 Tax=Dictyostelium purpureum TaxID=5786 RepID=F0ZVE8_DICPU|nr:uncharacterized protein DICPUDRAFT_82065 [Dictyostelium purpureum]EGC32074.1 hypothetical protein DICPUDRAFT_82065 [Dictyostelium purpureum]|eukprot:XP_003291397.1 hypothetical protein DICPUDRAFT_82065 [Dictyostelium purpureum]